ncbi:MAG: hypothetical protein ACOY93_20765 [Bacillota bacterium]
MAELYRLRCESEKSTFTLVLTESHVTIEPSPEFRAELEEAFARGRQGADKAPGVIGWIVDKAINFASNIVDKVFTPHPVEDVKIFIRGEKGDHVEIKFGRLSHVLGKVKVDPSEAYIFEAKLREAQERLAR